MLTDVVIANKTYAKINIADETTLDNVAIKVIRQDMPDFLLAMKMISIDGQMEIRYELGDGIRLKYLPDRMTKKEFLILMEGLLRPLKECSDWFLDYHNFCFDREHIIVEKDYSEVKYVYIPDTTFKQTDDSILNFLGEVVVNTNLTDDKELVLELFRFIKNNSLFSAYDFIVGKMGSGVGNNSAEKKSQQKQEPFISPASGSRPSVEPVTPEKKVPIAETPVAPEESQKQQEETPSKGAFGERDIKDKLIDNLFGEEDEPKKKTSKKEKEKKGLLEGLFGGGKTNAEKKTSDKKSVEKKRGEDAVQQPSASEQQQSMAYEEVSGGYAEVDLTLIPPVNAPMKDKTKMRLVLEDGKGYNFPREIELDLSKGHATVGRYDKAGNARADYNLDGTLSFVSKRHFRIERNGEQYAIVDVGSGNGTLLNSELLVPNMPRPIASGDRIVLSKVHMVTYRVL